MDKKEKEKEKKRLAKKLGVKVVDDPLFTDDDNSNVIWLTVEGNQEPKSLIKKIKDKYDTHKDNKQQRQIEKGNSFAKEADSLLSKQRYDDAIKSYQTAKEIFASQGYNEGCTLCDQATKKCYYEKAQGLATKAKQYENNKQFSFAIELYSAASEVYKSGDFDEYANKCDKCKERCYINIGDILFQQARAKFDNGDYDAANSLLAQAKTNYNTAGAYVKYRECDALMNKNIVLEGDSKVARAKSCKRYADVVNFYTLALADYKKAGDAKKAKQCQADLGMYIFNFGDTLYEEKQYDKAVPYFKESVKYLKAVDDPQIEKTCNFKIGYCLFSKLQAAIDADDYDTLETLCKTAKHHYQLAGDEKSINACDDVLSILNNHKQECLDDGFNFVGEADKALKSGNYYSAAVHLAKATNRFSNFSDHKEYKDKCEKALKDCCEHISETSNNNHRSFSENHDRNSSGETSTIFSRACGYSEEERLQYGIEKAVRDAEWWYNQGMNDFNYEKFEDAKRSFDKAKDAFILLDTRNLELEGVNLQDLELDNFRFEEQIKQCDAMFALCDAAIEQRYQEELARDMERDY